MALVIAQNKQLVQYVNKLKTHLNKSYKAIETMETLQKENTYLHYENQKLKQENHRLRNYITNTFEVVKHLFDFPKDRLKRLVDGFIKDLNISH